MIEIRQEFAPITNNPLYMLFNEKGQLGVIYDIGQSGIWGYEYWQMLQKWADYIDELVAD